MNTLLFIISSLISQSFFCSTNHNKVNNTQKNRSVDEILQSHGIKNIFDNNSSPENDETTPIMSEQEIKQTKDFLNSIKNPVFQNNMIKTTKEMRSQLRKQSPEVQENLKNQVSESLQFQKNKIQKTSSILKKRLNSLQKEIKNENKENQKTVSEEIEVLESTETALENMNKSIDGLEDALTHEYDSDQNSSASDPSSVTSSTFWWDTFWGVIAFGVITEALYFGRKTLLNIFTKLFPGTVEKISAWAEKRRASEEAAADSKIISKYQEMRKRGTQISDETREKYNKALARTAQRRKTQEENDNQQQGIFKKNSSDTLPSLIKSSKESSNNQLQKNNTEKNELEKSNTDNNSSEKYELKLNELKNADTKAHYDQKQEITIDPSLLSIKLAQESSNDQLQENNTAPMKFKNPSRADSRKKKEEQVDKIRRTRKEVLEYDDELQDTNKEMKNEPSNETFLKELDEIENLSKQTKEQIEKIDLANLRYSRREILENDDEAQEEIEGI